MGVIRNPEKISYTIDTKIFIFRSFQFWGGPGGGRVREPPRREGGELQFGATLFSQ